MVSEGWSSQLFRSWLLPQIVPALTGLGAVRRAMFATVSQTRINYRTSALSKGQAGTVWGSDRLPWLSDNYASLTALDWRLNVYGALRPALSQEAASLGMVTDTFPWDSTAQQTKWGIDAAHLIRPDGHVTLAMAQQDPAELHALATNI